MNKEFIPYEQALALKELGFDEDCFGKYEGKITNVFKPLIIEFTFANLPGAENKVGYPNYPYKDVEAPLYQQAFRWFREKYNCHHTIHQNKKYVGIAYSSVVNFSIDEFDTYEEAELECLKKLIEIVKEK